MARCTKVKRDPDQSGSIIGETMSKFLRLVIEEEDEEGNVLSSTKSGTKTGIMEENGVWGRYYATADATRAILSHEALKAVVQLKVLTEKEATKVETNG